MFPEPPECDSLYPEAPPPEAPGKPSLPGYPPPPPPPADVIVEKIELLPLTPSLAGVGDDEEGPPAPPPPTVIGKLDAVTVIGPAPSKDWLYKVLSEIYLL